MSTARERFQAEMGLCGSPVVTSHVSITNPVWAEYGPRLEPLQHVSPHVTVAIARQPNHAANSEKTDEWGCHWSYPLTGLDGICDGHPLASWDAFAEFRAPDPDAARNWQAEQEHVTKTRAADRIASASSEHGFFFLRLTYLRGFDNFMFDVADRPPGLESLIGMVEDYWFEQVRRWVEMGVDIIQFGDDLGLQHALPISPAAWRDIVKPSYRRIFGYCREHGVQVGLHSDGYIVDIIPDLLECGVSIVNPQDLVNGLDAIRRTTRGKACIRLDIDRQNVTVFGTPADCDTHLRHCIEMLGSPNGGLSLIWGVYPGTPFENIEACVHAMANYATLWGE